MITEKIKAKAIALLERRKLAEEVAEELDLPVMVVKDWEKTLSVKSLVALEATVHAIEDIEIASIDPTMEAKLKTKLEEAAHEIADQVYKYAGSGDPIHAKALQLNADAVTKLYQTIILKGQAIVAINPNGSNGSAFQQLSYED